MSKFGVGDKVIFNWPSIMNRKPMPGVVVSVNAAGPRVVFPNNSLFPGEYSPATSALILAGPAEPEEYEKWFV